MVLIGRLNMRRGIKAFLAAGACVLALGSGAVFAQRDSASGLEGRMQTQLYGRGGFADRFFAQFDLNHDGKVTRDELNKALAARFAAAAHGGAMTSDQFAQMHLPQFRQHTAQMFRRLDWNGDGRLSLDEFAGPQRARFEMFDPDGKGSESCAPGSVQDAGYRPNTRRGFGRAQFCAENDLNHDGQVTHAEFDSATAKRFAQATGGAKTMSEEQFDTAALKKYRESSAKYFARLDTDHDGKLSFAEFSSPEQKEFARLDKKGVGVVTRDALSGQDRFHRGG
jgi:Ca2+-binding EF-hand superfamily protein